MALGRLFADANRRRCRSPPAIRSDFFSIRSAATRQLFTRPEREEAITHLAEPINVPMPISRRVLAQYLAQYYGEQKSLWIRGVDISAINVCNLSDAGGGAWAHTPPAGRIAIDPVLGRIFFGDRRPKRRGRRFITASAPT